jgi:hypothetical protein
VLHLRRPKGVQKMPRLLLLLVKPVFQAIALLFMMLCTLPQPQAVLLQVRSGPAKDQPCTCVAWVQTAGSPCKVRRSSR